MRLLRRPNGAMVMTSRVTFMPGQYERLVEVLEAASEGQLAPVVRQLLQLGLETVAAEDDHAGAVVKKLLEQDCEAYDEAHRLVLANKADAWRMAP